MEEKGRLTRKCDATFVAQNGRTVYLCSYERN
uniref:Uncharacterized protein n=1 Tax=Anguilla anguilla TaxID=7936 RepID=A0A0E9UXN3_ANGAN